MLRRTLRNLLFFGGTAASLRMLASEQHPAQSRIAISHDLPALQGDHAKATLVEVTYRPGASSVSHTHPCPVIGFVLNGAIRFQVNSDPEVVLHAGESFYEPPNAIHRVSANASNTVDAKFLAFFVCDGGPELSRPVGSGS